MSEFKENVLSEISFAMIDDAPDLQKLYDKVAAIDEQPELDDNQQIVLDWLKDPLKNVPNRLAKDYYSYLRFAKDYFAYIGCLVQGWAPKKVLKAYRELSPEQQMQVLSAWAQVQEEKE